MESQSEVRVKSHNSEGGIRFQLVIESFCGPSGRGGQSGHVLYQSAVSFALYNISYNEFLIGTNWVCGFATRKYWNR